MNDKSFSGHISLESIELLFFQNGVNEEERQHFNDCPICQRALENLKSFKNSNHKRSKVTGRIVLKRLKRRKQVKITVKMVALVAMGLFFSMFFQNKKLGSDDFRDSLTWLKEEQMENGGWNVERWGGKKRFEIGISALALMSFIHCEPNSNLSSIQKGVSYLLNHRNEDGSFGERFLGDLYNHSLATLALKKAKVLGCDIPEKIIEQSMLNIRQYRNENGLWSYREGSRAELNLSAWALLALEGSTKGLNKVGISKGESQQSLTFGEEKTIAVNRTDLLDPMEVYLELNDQPIDSPRAWKNELLLMKEKEGALAGSWPVNGRWSHVGGRVFTTGIALLSMDSRF